MSEKTTRRKKSTTASRDELVKFMDNYLGIAAVRDASANGLQVEGVESIEKVAFLVDFSLQGLEASLEAGAQMMVVHHGLVWGGGLRYLSGHTGSRVRALIENGMNLYAAHLPLDMHPDCGNNIELLRLMGLKKPASFACYEGNDIGFHGVLPRAVLRQEFAGKIEQKLETEVHCLPFGPEKVRRVGFVSGAGADSLSEAVKLGLDLLVTGEARQSSYHFALENRINVIFAGHYATETLGVKALMKKIGARFNVQTEFLDLPTGI